MTRRACAARRGIVRERGSPVRSSMRSAAPSTPPTSRAPQASVRAQGGESARGATSVSTSASVTSVAVRPRRELVDLASQARRDRLPRARPSRRQASGSAFVFFCSLNCSETHRARQPSSYDIPDQELALGSRPPSRAASPSSACRRRARASPRGAGDFKYSATAFASGAFQALDALDHDEPCACPKEAHHVARGDGILAVPCRRRGAPPSRRRRNGRGSRADRPVDLRAVAARDQIGRLELVRHRRQA